MQQQVKEKVEEVEVVPSTVPQPMGNIPETLRTRLRAQIEFYFSPQNLARDTYLRNMLATYGGGAVPLTAIASFPKVRNLCASELGMVNSNMPADPRLLMNVLEGSQIVSVSPDAIWISPLLPIPPLDPSVKARPVPTGASSYVPDMRSQQQQPPTPNLAVPYAGDSSISDTLVIRDMPLDMKPDKVMEIFTHDEIVPKTVKVEAGSVWYVSFSTEEDTKHVLASKQELNIEGRDIHVSLAPVSHQQHMMPTYYAANPMPQIMTMPQQGINPGYLYSYPYRPAPSNGPAGYYMYPNLGHGHPMQYQQMYPGGIPPYRANAGQQNYFQSGMGRPMGTQVPFYNDKNRMRPLDSNGKVLPEGNNQNRNNKYDKKSSSSNGTENGRGSFRSGSRDGNNSKGMHRSKSQNEMSDSSNGEKKKNKRKNNSRKRDHDRRKDEVTLNVGDFPALSSGKEALEKQSSPSSGFSGYASALLRKNEEKRINEEEEKALESMKKLNITNDDIDQGSTSLPSESSPNSQQASLPKKESVVEGNGHQENVVDPQNAKPSANVDDKNKSIVTEEKLNSMTPPPTWGSKRSFIDVVKES
jgi:hypothetical protein